MKKIAIHMLRQTPLVYLSDAGIDDDSCFDSALAINRNGSLSCNEISMWIYAKAGQNCTIKLYIWVPYSILHTVM